MVTTETVQNPDVTAFKLSALKGVDASNPVVYRRIQMAQGFASLWDLDAAKPERRLIALV